jgi:hypothetical protein
MQVFVPPNLEGSPEGEKQLYSEDGVDLSLIWWFLDMTPAERLQHLTSYMQFVEGARHANPELARALDRFEGIDSTSS